MHSSILLSVIVATIFVSTPTFATPTVPLFGAAAPGAASIYAQLPVHPSVYSDLLRLSPALSNNRLAAVPLSHPALIPNPGPVTVDTMSLTPGRVHPPLANEHVEAMLFGRSSDEKNVVCYFRGPEEGCWVRENVGCHKKRCWRYCNRCSPSESKCGAKSWCYFNKDGSDYMPCETAEDCKLYGRNACNCYWGCKANGWSC